MYVFKNINVKAKIWNFAHKNTKLYAKNEGMFVFMRLLICQNTNVLIVARLCKLNFCDLATVTI